MTFVPVPTQLAVARLPVVTAVGGVAPVPNVHSYLTTVEVLPETCAVKITVSFSLGLLFDGVTITEGG